MEKIQRAICNIEGNFMSLILIDAIWLTNEWLHEAYLNNNEDIHKLKIQNEQLLERLQDTCSSSYVSNCNMVYCLEDSNDTRDHDKHPKLRVIDVFEDEIDESQ